MKFLRWLKNLFRQHPDDTQTTNPSDSNSSETPNSSTPSASIKPGLKIAIVRGHGGNDSGAVGNGTSEVEYNTWVMKYVEANTRRNVRCFYGDSSIRAVLASLTFKPDVTIQLHLNSYNKQAKGCEVLVVKGDTKSYPIAEKFASSFTARFGRVLRRPEAKGKKILESSDRGVSSLKASTGIKILVEPFFIDNKDDFVPKEDYAKFLTEFIEGV